MNKLVELRSLRLMLTTNGTFLSTRALEALRHCNDGLRGHMDVIVSLDGASPGTHDLLRGLGRFHITTQFIRALANGGVNTFLKCVLHQKNVHEVRDYIRLARELG